MGAYQTTHSKVHTEAHTAGTHGIFTYTPSKNVSYSGSDDIQRNRSKLDKKNIYLNAQICRPQKKKKLHKLITFIHKYIHIHSHTVSLLLLLKIVFKFARRYCFSLHFGHAKNRSLFLSLVSYRPKHYLPFRPKVVNAFICPTEQGQQKQQST